MDGKQKRDLQATIHIQDSRVNNPHENRTSNQQIRSCYPQTEWIVRVINDCNKKKHKKNKQQT